MYSSLEPWGEERADLRAGIISATLANVNRGDKNDKVLTPLDFMPYVAANRDNEAELIEESRQQLLDIKSRYGKMKGIGK